MSAEEWRPVVGWEGLYEVSSHGRVRSLPRSWRTQFGVRTSKITIRKLEHWQGYRRVGLRASGRMWKTVCVHRLVAEAFIGPCPEGMEVDHIDHYRSNNAVANLRYLTASENLARRPIRRGEHHGNAKLTKALVTWAREQVATGRTRTEVAAQLCLNRTTIAKAVDGTNWGWL